MNQEARSNYIGMSRPNALTELTAKQSPQSSPQWHQFHDSLQGQPLLRTNRLIRENEPLVPGTLLYGRRYRLAYTQGQQQWLAGVYETNWIAQDIHRQGASVMISEVNVSGSVSHIIQSLLRTAMHALSLTGKLSHAVELLDVFRDRDKNFFVFQAVDGVSLLSYMQHSGQVLQEQEVINGCLQIVKVLEECSHQSLVHGLIRPEHIVVTRGSLKWYLTNFSIIVAGGAIQYISGIDRSLLSPYTAPEFSAGMIDVRSDLYALIATAYHMATGSPPANSSERASQSQQLNPPVSSPLAAIFSKGLYHVMDQRYQQPSELLQDLLALSSASNTSGIGSKSQYNQRAKGHDSASERQLSPLPAQVPSDTVAQIFSSLVAQPEQETYKNVLPRPEELPPLPKGNHILIAACWLAVILICFFILAVLP